MFYHLMSPKQFWFYISKPVKCQDLLCFHWQVLMFKSRLNENKEWLWNKEWLCKMLEQCINLIKQTNSDKALMFSRWIEDSSNSPLLLTTKDCNWWVLSTILGRLQMVHSWWSIVGAVKMGAIPHTPDVHRGDFEDKNVCSQLRFLLDLPLICCDKMSLSLCSPHGFPLTKTTGF